MSAVFTPDDVAAWMLSELEREHYLYQSTVVYDMAEKFGSSFVYDNDNGHLAIDPKVLKAFRRITGDRVVWERGQRLWRFREDYDPEGKRQSD